MNKSTEDNQWPMLPYNEWKDTLVTVHMWTQIIGKIKLRLNPFLNQWWEVGFSITPTGMTTDRIPYDKGAFEVNLNFLKHTINVTTSDGEAKSMSLAPMSVKDFYSKFMALLDGIGIHVDIYPVPSEVSMAVPFEDDTIHTSYDRSAAERWWRIQLQGTLVFDQFRRKFRGKSSPILFYWGGFDLNGTRFSGKQLSSANLATKGFIGRYADNEENYSYGFWPGDAHFPEPAFYSYLAPAPKGIETIHVEPKSAYFSDDLGEWILPYDKLIQESDPNATLLRFLETSYQGLAKLARWDTSELEGAVPF